MANADLNLIRRRGDASAGNLNLTVKSDLLDAILLERRKELAFEGFRYLDIKRIGALANQSIDRNITDDLIKTVPTTISNTDYRFTLPIPQDEISASGSIIVQNPNY